MLRKLYDWVLHWAETPYAEPALFLIAFAESSFFPIPPDVLLIALALSIPARSFRYALICSVGSVTGGMFGYFIGYGLWEGVGRPIFEFYGYMGKYEWIRAKYEMYNAWAVGIAGFTPVPYKVFTIAAGACRINFTVFVLASAFSRAARFFLVGGLIRAYGEPIRGFIEKYLNIITVVFVVFLIGGFIFVKWLAG